MKVLNEEYRVITVDCSHRLNQLIKRFCSVCQKRENTWFNKTLKKRLLSHRNKISHHVRRHIRMHDANVIMSIKIKRKFGTRDKYTSELLVKK